MSAQPKMETTARIPAEINTKLRALAHDLSNSLETIMQASYLLAQMKLDENAKRWADLIDQAGRDAARGARRHRRPGPTRSDSPRTTTSRTNPPPSRRSTDSWPRN